MWGEGENKTSKSMQKCYYHPDAKKMREAKKAAVPKCSIDGCGGNELRSYGLCNKHYRKSVEDAKDSVSGTAP